MRKKLELLILFVCVITSTNAQEKLFAGRMDVSESKPTSTHTQSIFQFMASSEVESVKNISDDIAGSHFLGSEIAKKMYLYDERYSYKEPVAPGNSATKTIFRKPAINTSVKKIEKYLKKQLKEKNITKAEACSDYSKVLDVALNILDVNTDNFEKRLKSTGRDASKLLNIYLNEVKLEYIN